MKVVIQERCPECKETQNAVKLKNNKIVLQCKHCKETYILEERKEK